MTLALGGGGRLRSDLTDPDAQPYVLKPLLRDIRLAGDDPAQEVHITCVEYWNENLYVGTSTSEILHFVSLPVEPSADSDEPTFIEASRIQTAGRGNEGTLPNARGVQSITILAAVSRACILSNGTLSFYTLPELSPAHNGRDVQNCQWVGGLNLNCERAAQNAQDAQDAPELMVASSRRVMIVKVGDKIQGVKSIHFPGCLRSVRRGTIACVADGKNYALLEIEQEQKISLFPISSLENAQDSSDQVEDLPVRESHLPGRISSLAQLEPRAAGASSHGRSTSLGNLVAGLGRGQPSPRGDSSSRERLASPLTRVRSRSPTKSSLDAGSSSLTSPLHRLSASGASSPVALPSTPKAEAPNPTMPLKPHILSLTPSEFLLTTGTTENEPGVGIFVNLDGDVVRGTVEFERYPQSMVLDQSGQTVDFSESQGGIGGTLCVLMSNEDDNGVHRRIQILQLTSDPDEMTRSADWITIANSSSQVDIQSTASKIPSAFRQVSDRLRLVRLHRPSNGEVQETGISASDTAEDLNRGLEEKRDVEEQKFAQNFGKTESQVVVWVDDKVFSLNSNPLLLQLEAKLGAAGGSGHEDLVKGVFDDLRQREIHTETDFLSFNYIRQKASLLLFGHLLLDSGSQSAADTMRVAENMLVESNLDPRVLMLFMPLLRQEVLQGPQGIWISAGLAHALEGVLEPGAKVEDEVPVELWQMVKRYLAIWQGKRGFGSIADERFVFDSVDAGLLRILLHLEQWLPRGSTAVSAIRAKLNNVVDHWKGDFDRAVELLERYHRLFALSRLYQSRRLAKDVLATWKRVVDGEADGVGELTPESAQMQIRRYLVNLGDVSLVREYALWLAHNSPMLGIEAFTDERSRVKFQPQDVLPLLKQNAPGAVQYYLEHLVFNQGDTKYTDDLIGYFLDSVLDVLDSSEAARNSLSQSYAAYRALEAPKATYLDFIRANAPAESWWQSRLRLLQLLAGGQYGAATSSPGSELTYSIQKVLERLAPFSSYLVSESIILDAHQGKHQEALRLLTHGLGDYDTAVRYCYFAGPQPSSTGPMDESQLPAFDLQKDLFNALIEEFLSIEDLSARLERSSDLLAKFARWFDPMVVLEKIPDEWSVEIMSEFLLRTMRAIRSEMLEASVVKALSAAENLRKQAEFVEFCEGLGAQIEAEKSARADGDGDTGALPGQAGLTVGSG